MRRPVSRALVLFSCISAAFALDSDNSTRTNDEDDGSFYSPSPAFFIFFFLILFWQLTCLMVSLHLIVQVAFDVAAYCCGYRILPEEQRYVGEPFYFRERETGRESAIRYIMARYRTPNMSDNEESYTHTFQRHHPANNSELVLQEQQDQQLVLLVPTCCPRYASVSEQCWWLLVILRMMVIFVTIPLVVLFFVTATDILRHFGMSTTVAYTLLLVVYGGVALFAFSRSVTLMRSGSSDPMYSRVTDQPDDMNEGDAKKKSVTEFPDDHVALTENVV